MGLRLRFDRRVQDGQAGYATIWAACRRIAQAIGANRTKAAVSVVILVIWYLPQRCFAAFDYEMPRGAASDAGVVNLFSL